MDSGLEICKVPSSATSSSKYQEVAELGIYLTFEWENNFLLIKCMGTCHDLALFWVFPKCVESVRLNIVMVTDRITPFTLVKLMLLQIRNLNLRKRRKK